MHSPIAVLVLTFLEYPMGWSMAQYRYTDTATRQKMEIVQRTTRTDTVNRQACRFVGRPKLARMANGIPSNPTSRSAIANEMM